MLVIPQIHGSARRRSASVASLTLIVLAACSTPEPVTHDISPRAMAALPPDQDLSMVHRGTDGCYMYIKKGPLTGHLLQLTDETGEQICDDVRD